MEYNRLIDRKAETDRITEALKREDSADCLMETLEQKAKYLPFIKKGQQVHLVLFMKEAPTYMNEEAKILLPEDIMQ